MSRLTEKVINPYTDKVGGYIQNKKEIKQINFFGDERDLELLKVFDKLGKLEDIEEELGCPLEVVFKVLQDDIIWYETESGMTYSRGMSLLQFGSLYFYDMDRNMFNLKDYKKTWWFREDKSE